MIIVTGATGQLGRAIVQNLVGRIPANQVGASVRDVGKAADLEALGVRVRQGDFAKPESLSGAFEGATQILIVSSNAAAYGGDPLAQHRSAIDAARAAGARRIVYTSHMGASASSAFPPMRDHAATEAVLAHSGMAWTGLRNGFYAASGISLMGDAPNTGLIEAPEDGQITRSEQAAPGGAGLLVDRILDNLRVVFVLLSQMLVHARDGLHIVLQAKVLCRGCERAVCSNVVVQPDLHRGHHCRVPDMRVAGRTHELPASLDDAFDHFIGLPVGLAARLAQNGFDGFGLLSSVNIRARWWIDPPLRTDVVSSMDEALHSIKEALVAEGIDLPFPTRQVLFHDQTEKTDGDRAAQREGWPAGKGKVPGPRSIAGALQQRREDASAPHG